MKLPSGRPPQGLQANLERPDVDLKGVTLR